MLSVSFNAALEHFQQSFGFNAMPWLALGVALLCWRLWRFTIFPLLTPAEPNELPYWIPYFGHAISFSRDYYGTLENARKYFKNTKEPYSLWIAGSRIYICSSPEDVAGLLANTTTITNQNVFKELFMWLGISQDGFSKIFHLDPSAKHNIGLGHPQEPAWMIDEFHRHQTKPGELLDDLMYKRFIPEIDKTLERVADGSSPSIIAESADGVTVSLLRTCINIFVGGTITSFLGNQIREANPALVEAFLTWERTSWKYMFKLPKMLSRDMLQARDEMIDIFVQYLSVPTNERKDATYFTKATEAMMREVGCSNQDIAKVLVVHFWTILGNVYKVAFWTLAHMAYDPSLLERILIEVEPAVKDGRLDESYLAESCPLLESLISEVSRLTVASALGRDVISPTPIRDKILRPGSKLLFPVHQLHLNPSVWGPDPRRMDPDRFVRNPKLYSSRSYRPFGGGHSLCPGRFFAKRTIAYAVAAMVTKFDIRVDIDRTRKSVRAKCESKQAKAAGINSINFPRVDISKPSPGASLPAVQGEDVFLVLKKKK